MCAKKNMTTRTENVVCMYDEKGALTAILKRDETTGHKLIHLTNEADVEDITSIIDPDHTLI